MKLGVIFGFVFCVIVINLLLFYWLFPLDTIEFSLKPGERNYNFTINSTGAMQFYENMRYSSSNISYSIKDACTLKKKEDMQRAFDIVANLSVLNFYPVGSNEEISVTCKDEIEVNERFFVAGEGGPVNITSAGNFNVILKGSVLLLKESECPNPNIAIHELFHALGFDHSLNKNNIMYNVSKCSQEIGDDIMDSINKIYSYPSQPDLSLENATALMHGRYLDTNISIRNTGLADSGESKIIIYADGDEIEEIPIDKIKTGFGLTLRLGNIFVSKFNVEELTFEIRTNFEELNKENNKIKLEIKSN
ncbi:MAG: matrixin family metalloprotease [Nanoarchaeota archaeon]